ncbi:MAG: FAD:protein FMN transferase [Waddliaceae bacterium]
MIFVALFIFLLFSCEPSDAPRITLFAGTAMTMHYRIMVGKVLTSKEKSRVKTLIHETFSDINDGVNKWNPQSELSRLNRAKAGESLPLSSELAQFLKETAQMVWLSEGRFDPTIEPLYRLWKTQLEKGRIPSSEEIQRAAAAIGWEKIHFEENRFWKDHGAVQLDFGGIAKGYAIDLLTERLREKGYDDIYVEWGGEIRTSGEHPEGRPWRVLVSKFGSLDVHYSLAVVDLQDEAIATSGDYVQNWVVDGITYYHLIDPAAHRPLISGSNTVCSVTVVAPTCMLADALATSAMMFPTPETTKEWLERQKKIIPALKYWVVSRSSKTGFAGSR